jgi:transcriptional regulator with XRE-family HTH domain
MKLDLQFIDYPNGKERLVVLLESQFRILERAARTGLKQSEAESSSLPNELLDKIAAGENPVRAVRLWRGLNGRQLSTLVGITPSMLSQIERTGKTGSTRTFRAISEVLGVPLALLFPNSADE